MDPKSKLPSVCSARRVKAAPCSSPATRACSVYNKWHTGLQSVTDTLVKQGGHDLLQVLPQMLA